MSNTKLSESVLKERERRGCSYCLDRPKCHARVDKCHYPELEGYASYDEFMQSAPDDDIMELIHDLFCLHRDSL